MLFRSNYPAKAADAQFPSRWTRFRDPDVARFHRDYLRADAKKELDLLAIRRQTGRDGGSATNRTHALVQLHSLLLNESPTQLAPLVTPDTFTGPPAGQIANCLAVLRVSHPTRFERLIPGGEPSPFVAGAEREVAGPNIALTQTLEAEAPDAAATTHLWPRVIWKSWKTPTGATWNFGSVRPARTNPTGVTKTIPLSWNTKVITYERP